MIKYLTMSFVSAPSKCNYFEINIGQSESSHYNCNITKDQFNIWQKKCSLYKKKEITTKKLYYKQIVLEHIYKPEYFHEQLISYHMYNNKLIQYYTKTPIKSSEFPCKKQYTNEETYKTTQFFIDKNINVFFNYEPDFNIKITCNNNKDLNLNKLYTITQLFT